ncbi:hypothetical protein BK129_14695 [Paenibacillus amylolyticus]|uniref:hypothetical protein n=1 Tax=Paenibacillus amylolyticus TaxID=1451 RepID=UPI00096E3D42|nr:hypothetical protein [Paenibacillus amylolyticus]OMF05233.1 hypothetical protein BK129_14695 [Paenibacillus amylolyticus]
MTTARRDAEANGVDDMVLLFTDTLIEDGDLYRFLIESAAKLFGLPKPIGLLEMCKDIPHVKETAMRKEYLSKLADEAMRHNSNLVWISEGREPWEVFRDARWIGNSRVAQCSAELKQKVSRKWVESHYKPDEAIIYVGIDWTEIHRMGGIQKGWAPYQVKAPMTEAPYWDKQEMMQSLKQDGIQNPRLYGMGFAHNNCGGFCVRAGQGHFINLLKEDRDLYLYHEQKEIEMQRYLEREDVSILTRTVKGLEETLTLRQLREEWEQGLGNQIDLNDIGGCGCFAFDTPEMEKV